MEDALDLNLIKKKMLRKYPAFGATINSVKYQIVGDNHPITTAATDGKTIYVNNEFMSKLSEQEQVFVFAHEVCHIALNHIMRSKGKDHRIWNIATDAVINQHLQNDGLTIASDAVNIADALKYDAEELYEKLLQQKQNKQGQNGQGNKNQNQDEQSEAQQNQQCQGGKGQGQKSEGQQESEHQVGHDSHSMWEDAVKKAEQSQTGMDKSKQDKDAQKVSEKDVFTQNEQAKVKRAEEIMSKINRQRRGFDLPSEEVLMSDVGAAGKAVTNWKKLLVRSLEIEDEAWGHRFSDKSNGYSARIEDVEYDEKAETEIILDTSGSVSVELLKNFLRQVKTVLKNSSIRVGTFSDDFHGWINIKRESDINDFRMRIGGGTNFDAASKAFTKRKDVNKICFTDGLDNGDAKIANKRKDIVWVSFVNQDFKPDNGKVIFVPKNLINLKTHHEELTM